MKPLYGLWIACGGLLLISGCQSRSYSYGPTQSESDQAYYPRQAYREQRAEQRAPIRSTEQRELSEEDFVLNLDERRNPHWERRAYERIDDWLARIHDIMRTNRDVLDSLREELKAVESDESQTASRMQGLLRQNEQLRSMVSDAYAGLEEDEEVEEEELVSEVPSIFDPISDRPMPKPQFFTHLIKTGETLASIARYYYGDEEMYHRILRWNQGWIRSPDDLLAGLGLLMFEENANSDDPQVVDVYLKQLEAHE